MAFVSFILIGTAYANQGQIRFLNKDIGISDSIVEAYVNEGNTKAIVIIQADSLIIEHFFADSGETTKHFSLLIDRLTALSLLETALNEGYVYSTNEPVRKYLPELPEKGFSLVNLAGFLNLGSADSKALPIPEGLLEIKTPINDTFQVITELCCLIVERATGTKINEYYQNKLSGFAPGIENPISLNGFQADSVIYTGCGFLLPPKDWVKMAQRFLLNGMQDSLLIKNGNDFLFLSKPGNLIILWIGKEPPGFDIYGFAKKLSEPG
ncbi:MAG: hypothetical protein GXO89_13980 [Chlorobi bacterium]|nr:hypothetical protein [Chlorobiota bacterium]